MTASAPAFPSRPGSMPACAGADPFPRPSRAASPAPGSSSGPLLRGLCATALALALAACGGAGDDARPATAGQDAAHAHDDGHDDAHDHAEDPPHDHAGDDAHDHAEDDGHGHARDGAGAEAGADSVVIPATIAEEVGIRVAAVAAGTIADQHEVQGLLTTLENASARVAARFPGPVRRLHVGLGDWVRAGQPLATIESNLSLSTYTVAAPISGTVLAKEASVGQVVAEGDVLYEVADLSRLWVDLHVFGRDAEHLAPRSPVTVRRLGDGATAQTVIDRTLPGTATASQSTIARATIDNADGQWRPGAAVRALVTVSLDAADLVVPLSALQEVEGRQVVFVREADTYSARPVTLGRRDAERVEVTSGLEAGELVVVEQSYTIKADLGKAGAAHEH